MYILFLLLYCFIRFYKACYVSVHVIVLPVLSCEFTSPLVSDPLLPAHLVSSSSLIVCPRPDYLHLLCAYVCIYSSCVSPVSCQFAPMQSFLAFCFEKPSRGSCYQLLPVFTSASLCLIPVWFVCLRWLSTSVLNSLSCPIPVGFVCFSWLSTHVLNSFTQVKTIALPKSCVFHAIESKRLKWTFFFSFYLCKRLDRLDSVVCLPSDVAYAFFFHT